MQKITFICEKSAVQQAVPSQKSVGVLSTYFSDYIFPHIMTGIESVLGDAGYTMQLSITHNQVMEEMKALESMLSSGVCGLIVEPSKSALPNPNASVYKELHESGVPLVFFNAKYSWADYPCVAMDDKAAGRVVTDYLISCGHKNICGLFVLDDIQGHLRYSGYMESCLAHNVRFSERNVFWFATSDRNSIFDYAKGKLLDLLKRSTAVVCYNDKLAVNLLKFCKENGIRVPEDLSIVGIDDSRYASICEVPLTTVHHPHSELGKAAARKLISMMNHRTAEQRDEFIVPELIVRSSVAKI